MSDTNSNDHTFELGLVMAGAISAGAYTAGVIDFLFEALDEWEAAKKRDEDVPMHNVKINVVSGTSAGGMTAALIGLCADRDVPKVTNLNNRKTNNPLFDSWVNDIDIYKLLDNRDQHEDQIPSILDSTVLDDIAAKAFRPDLPYKKREYINEELLVQLMVTNLRGIPYEIKFDGPNPQGHVMSKHEDYLEFALSQEPKKDVREPIQLKAGHYDTANWSIYREAALASGAFPLGLASRILSVHPDQYLRRTWHEPQETCSKTVDLTQYLDDDVKLSCYKEVSRKPDWSPEYQFEFDRDRDKANYKYWSVDGGAMNNEPFEIARRRLSRGDRNPRGNLNAKRMMIMVDPFVGWSKNAFKMDVANRPDLIKTAGWIISALIAQARFKPDELELAMREDVKSRFLVAPQRSINEQHYVNSQAIACGCLGGFGGFLKREFRVHDYVLGRKNCQKFLANYFTLEMEEGKINKRFKFNSIEDQKKWSFNGDDKTHIPIIPLIGDLKKTIPSPEWPQYDYAELSRLKRAVKGRIKHLVKKTINDADINGWVRVFVDLFVKKRIEKKIVNKIIEEVEKNLIEHKLINRVGMSLSD